MHYLTLMDATNLNIKKSYSEILPKLNVEFEELQEKLKTQINNSLNTLDNNLILREICIDIIKINHQLNGKIYLIEQMEILENQNH